jgi:hypothetical protein
VLAKPGETKDHALLAQQGDCELGSLCMAFVVQNNVCDLGDSASLVCGSVNVEDGDGSGEAMSGDVVQADIFSVDEQAGSTAVDKRTCVALHRCDRHLNFDVDVERVFAPGCCDNKFLWQMTFGVGKANSHYRWGRRRGLWHDFRTIKYACIILTLVY